MENRDGNPQSRSGQLVYEVLVTVSEHEGIPIEEIDTPLRNVIDPESLDALFTDRKSDRWRVEFTYRGHRVAIEPDCDVTIID